MPTSGATTKHQDADPAVPPPTYNGPVTVTRPHHLGLCPGKEDCLGGNAATWGAVNLTLHR